MKIQMTNEEKKEFEKFDKKTTVVSKKIHAGLIAGCALLGAGAITTGTLYGINVVNKDKGGQQEEMLEGMVTQKQWVEAINYLKNRSEERNYTINVKDGSGTATTTLKVDGLKCELDDLKADINKNLYEQKNSNGLYTIIKDYYNNKKVITSILEEKDESLSIAVKGNDKGDISSFYYDFGSGLSGWEFNKENKAYTKGDKTIKFDNNHKIIEASNENFTYTLTYGECTLSDITPDNSMTATYESDRNRYIFSKNYSIVEGIKETDILEFYCSINTEGKGWAKGDYIRFGTETNIARHFICSIKYRINGGDFKIGRVTRDESEFFADLSGVEGEIKTIDFYVDAREGVAKIKEDDVTTLTVICQRMDI